jgi:hypothetical protein
MVDDPIREYLDKRNDAAVARAAVKRMGERVQHGAYCLNNTWAATTIEHVDVALPMAGTSGSAIPIDGREWPTATQIAETLHTCHLAYDAMQAAWKVLAVAHQAGLQPPLAR